jgi:hypothetical protein
MTQRGTEKLFCLWNFLQTIQQPFFPLIDQLQYQFPKQGICPGKPNAGKFFRMVFVKTFVLNIRINFVETKKNEKFRFERMGR